MGFVRIGPMPIIAPFAGVDRRTAWLRGTLLVACLLGLLISWPLWLNARTFPLLPVSSGFPVLPAPWDKCFFGLMLLSLVLAGWFYRAAVGFFLVAGLFAFCEDQNRGQPWFYMYWVMLCLTLLPPTTAIAASRWAVSAAYVWSGIQKLHPAFFNRVPDWFVAPATHWHLPATAIGLLRFAIAMAPFVELFIGLALWTSRLRKAAIGAVVVVHLTALLLLGPFGYNYDVVIWPWNLAMIAFVIALFATPADARVFGFAKEKVDALPSSGTSIPEAFAEVRRSKPGLAVIVLYSCLPLFSYIGWWDSYFSFTLYAENQAKADIFVSQAFADRLPPQLSAHVHQLAQAYNPQIQGPYVFDFQTWGFTELHVPPILEPRHYRAIFHHLRAYSKDPNDLRMILSPRFGPIVFYQGESNCVLTPTN
jgi:hypothetical protein